MYVYYIYKSKPEIKYYRLIYAPHSYVEIQTPKRTIFENRDFEEVK